MSDIRKFAKNWLPPVVAGIAGKFFGRRNRFYGNYSNWEAAAAQCVGYQSQLILDKVLDSTLKVKRGEAAFERDSVLFETIEYRWPVIAGLMWGAAQFGGRLDVLDFGGALGSSYFQSRAFLKGLRQVRWSVVEQAHYVEAGIRHIQDDTLRFYHSIADCCAVGQPNSALLSSVLQYLPQPENVIRDVDSSRISILIVDRTPLCDASEDQICIQRVPTSIYPASYPMRVFSRNRIMKLLEKNWDTVADVLSPEGVVSDGVGHEIEFRTLLLKRKSRE
jgi:putative methyltransferase (TIGR04325 family)